MARGGRLHRFSALFWAIGVGLGIVALVAAIAVPTSPAAGPEQGPVAAWSFDEGEGTTAEDVTGDGHTATLEGTEWARGRYGDALKFDGASACATIADSADLAPTEEFTVEAWVRPEGPRSHEPILVKEGGGFPDYSLGIGSLLAEASIGTAGGGHESVSGSFLEPDVWRHLAATFDGAALRLFVDGELVGTRAIASPDSSGPGALTVGCDRLLGTHFDGRVDELRIYDRVLGGTEVAADMETPLQTPKSGPVAAWSFDEREGTTAEDVAGHGHTATIEGAEWVRGKYGDGLNFDSESDVLRVADSPEFDLTEEFTLEAWVRPEYDFETWAPILSKKGSNASEQLWWLYMAGNKYNRPWAGVEQAPGFEQSVEAPEPIPSETWTHLALTWDGSVTSLYVDGRPVASAYTDPPRVGGGELEIGADTGIGDWFEGRIDEVRVYDRSLSAAEVGTDMGTPIRSPRSGPVAAWSFDEGEGTTAEDMTGDGHTATIEGAEWTRGRYGDALRFDGTSDVVRVPASPEFDLAEGFTLEAWVRPESAVNQWAPVVNKLGEGKKANEQPWWLYEANQKVNVPFAGIEPSAGRETPIEANESESLPVDAWSHLAVTWDGSLMSLYIDGRVVRTTPAGPLRVTAAGEVQIGADTELGDFLDGRIDEIRIYARPLDTGEIDTDMETPLATPKAGPVAAYAFDEGEGETATDVTGNGHTATLQGTEWVRGHYGDALRFDGRSACATIADAADLRFGEEFTVESWVRPEGPRSHEPVLFKEGGGFPDYSLGIGSGTAEASIGTGAGGRESVSAVPLEADTWRHLALTFDGARLRLYVDGELVASRAVALPDASGPGPLTIGCDALDGTHFDGRVDEARIYDRALTAGEVQTDMETPLQTPEPGPIAAWSFDEGEGTMAEDVTGDSHEGTIEGAEWVRGKYGDALKFDGPGDVVKVPHSPEFVLSEEFTLEAWVRPESASNEWAPILAKEMGGGAGAHELAWHLYEGGTESNRPAGGIDPLPGKEDNVYAPDPLPVDVWSHLALTWDGARLRLFVDGALVASAPASQPPLVTEGELQIGAATDRGDHMVGRIDEPRIYNRALDEAEVKASMEPLPEVGTAEPYGIEGAEAVMAATVNPRNLETTYKFQYGPTKRYGTVVPEEPEEVFTGNEPLEVEEVAEELLPETTYHYRVIAHSEAGTTVGADQTLTTGPEVSPEEELQPLAEKSWRGFFNLDWTGKRYEVDEEMNMVEKAGAETFRYAFDEDFTKTNEFFAAAASANHPIRILPDLSFKRIEAKDPGTGTREKWVNFVEESLKRYGDNGTFWTSHPGLPKLVPEYWEIWNEENYGDNGNSNGVVDPAQFAELLKETHEAFERVDPGAKIMLGGLLTVSKKEQGPTHLTVGGYLHELNKAGGSPYYQALSLHPYAFKGSVHGITRQVMRNISKARKALNHVGGQNKKIWVTEIGWPVGGPSGDKLHVSVSQEKQKELLESVFGQIKARSSSKGKGLGIEKAFYYNVQNNYYGVPHDWSMHCGLREDLFAVHVSKETVRGTPENGNYRKAWYAFQREAESPFLGKFP